VWFTLHGTIWHHGVMGCGLRVEVSFRQTGLESVGDMQRFLQRMAYFALHTALQCIAVRCSALQCVAVRCSVLQCVAVRCSVLQCVAVCCSVL